MLQHNIQNIMHRHNMPNIRAQLIVVKLNSSFMAGYTIKFYGWKDYTVLWLDTLYIPMAGYTILSYGWIHYTVLCLDTLYSPTAGYTIQSYGWTQYTVLWLDTIYSPMSGYKRTTLSSLTTGHPCQKETQSITV